MACMRTLGGSAALIALGIVGNPASAQTTAIPARAGQDGPSILDDGQQQGKNTDQTVEACWTAWLAKERLVEGKNERGTDSILVEKGMEVVSAEAKTAQWLTARNVAFQRAEIQARQAMSEPVGTLIRSDRSITDQNFGGDSAPEELEKVAKSLSIADKVDVLTDAALDSEIKKYKPNWNGSGVDTAKKRDILAKTIGTFRENIAASSSLYVSGAFTPVQCEGPNRDGQYAVLVGMIWSPKLAKIAETIWNPGAVSPLAPSKGTLQDQFTAFGVVNPDWLAYSLGARVLTDEKGERVVVGFGVAPQTSLMSMDASRASLNALTAIQRFVGEKAEANQEQKTAFAQIESADGDVSLRDSGDYKQVVRLYSKEQKIQGATQVMSWRGTHPWSGAKMEVVVVAWSPAWAADARRTGAAMKDIEQRMQRQGAVPAVAAPAEASMVPAPGGSAAPVKSGAQSSTGDF